MNDFGFISDKLEIKFLILYIASRMMGPAPFEVLQELSMCDGGVDYFGFSECLADLVRTEHLRVDQDGLYVITEKGRRNSAICESSLPSSVRMQAEQSLLPDPAPRGGRLHGHAVPQRRAGRSDESPAAGHPPGHGPGAAKAVPGPRGGDLLQDIGGPLRR